MLLSVVVPFFNVELYVRECLESIAGQDVRDLEVILVDDGSTDGTRGIAEEFVAADDRFRLVTQANQGLGPARNAGMVLATGRYLTFVDSDDIVPRRAWRTLIANLERTGSAFAAGDARRFNIHGVRASWLHEQIFTETRTRTHVDDVPRLANDRMVWNKVYRRSFWEAGGYAFPPIMYEDYPVTLRAYLEADAVDMVSDPVYMWRERDGGEQSITQRGVELKNVQDRVTSAMAVLDLAAGASAPVRRAVHHHLAGTDVGALARAVTHPSNVTDTEVFLSLSHQLLTALDPAVVATRRPLERLQFQLLLDGRVDDIRTLAAVREQQPPAASHEDRGRLRKRHLVVVEGIALGETAEWARLLAPAEIDLDARVLAAVWDGDVLRLDLEAWIHFAGPGSSPSLEAWLERGDSRVALASVSALDVSGACCRGTFAVSATALLGDGAPGDWFLRLRLHADGIVREGSATKIVPGSATLGTRWTADGWTWLLGGKLDGRYAVRVLRWGAVVTAVGPGYGEEIALTGRSRQPLPLSGAELLARGSAVETAVPLLVDVGDPHVWRARIQLAAITQDRTTVDEALAATTEYALSLRTRTDELPIALEPAVDVQRFTRGHREVQVVASRFGQARLDEMNPEFTVEEVVASGTWVTFRGRWLDTRAVTETAILRWHHDPDRPEDVTIPLEFDGTWFSFGLDVAELADRMSTTLSAVPEHPEAVSRAGDWLLSFDHFGHPMTAHLSSSLVRRLPTPWTTNNGRVSLSTHRKFAARLHVSDIRITSD
ncbi:MAG: glycosyltransferase family 2 protein [Marmoricola sp.]|nr:glycosyltransferase family 2 protein [Marmoricola sp.]